MNPLRSCAPPTPPSSRDNQKSYNDDITLPHHLASQRKSVSSTSKSSKTQQEELCEICVRIPFDANDPPFGGYTGSTEFVLGTIKEVRRRDTCPLCQLVTFTIYGVELDKSLESDITEDYVVRFEWQEGSERFILKGAVLGSYVCLVNESNPPVPGKKAQPIRGTQIDPARIKYWLSACVDCHGEVCNPRWPQNPTDQCIIPGLHVLRVIDVVDKCIVQAPNPCRYLALSYVWGGVPNFKLRTENKKSLMTAGMLTKMWHIIPQTIKDAIDLVERIGERYLWVDSMCLIQDDETDMQRGIGVMDLVYERALMTVVAGAGRHANYGLPGVRDASRTITQRIAEVKPGLRLAVMNELDHCLQLSEYDRRGWTFQEQFLSRRAVYFINNQTYFRCRQCIWSEDTVYDLHPLKLGLESGGISSLLYTAWEEDFTGTIAGYDLLVLYYTKRKLTNEGDALNAMAGLLRRHSVRMKCRFLEGLPTAAFDIFLTFHCYRSNLRHRLGFPSYSWAGWIGGVIYDIPGVIYDEENAWPSERTLYGIKEALQALQTRSRIYQPTKPSLKLQKTMSVIAGEVLLGKGTRCNFRHHGQSQPKRYN